MDVAFSIKGSKKLMNEGIVYRCISNSGDVRDKIVLSYPSVHMTDKGITEQIGVQNWLLPPLFAQICSCLSFAI